MISVKWPYCDEIMSFARTHFARAERVVALYFRVRIGVRGDALRASGRYVYTDRVVILASAHYTPAPLHSSLTSFARAAAVLTYVRLVTSFEFVVFKRLRYM